MDIQYATEIGYYFDRCIDLTFYDTDMEFLGKLTTPAHGLKPTITIKGLLIEGGYAIDSYISIQNMAFDVDIASIGYVKAKMYYSGLKESVRFSSMTSKVKNGHTILFRVLYADQEKEPPNRCIRFQCVVASKEVSLYDTPLYISGGSAKYLSPSEDANKVVVDLENKEGSKVPLKNLCVELINIYNKGIQQNTEAGKNKQYYELLQITLLEIDEPLEKINVQLSSGEYKIGDLIRQLNSNTMQTEVNGFAYSEFKIVVDRNTMRVSTVVPSDWKKVAKSEGYNNMTYEEYYNKNYASVKTNVYNMLSATPQKTSSIPVIPLNFVKSATRSEGVIYVETFFDDRITPGCHVAIKGNAIMGKKFGSAKSAKGGSRLLHYWGDKEPVIFRNTGKIEYLFSTTEDSYMKMQGPVDESEEALKWAKTEGMLYE